MAVVRLYTQRRNPFSEKVASALALKRLPFERVVSDSPEDIRRWSPISQRLPVLEVDGRRRHESAAILDWLDEIQPDPPLLARDVKTAEAQRRLAEWSDSSFLWYWDRWRMARYPLPGDEQPADPSLLARLRSGLGRTLGRGHSPASRVALRELEVLEGIARRLDDLVGFLGNRPYFHADAPSVADLSVHGMLRLLSAGPIPGAPALIAQRAPLVAHRARMDAIPPTELPAGPGSGQARSPAVRRVG